MIFTGNIINMKMLDLFSGIGGFSLAGKWAGFETIQFDEENEYEDSMKDFEYLVKISQVLTSPELDMMTQLSCIRNIMYGWTLSLKPNAPCHESKQQESESPEAES